MQDGINNGMTGDPVQFSCQQNFTIMTTDGYWNAQDESVGIGGGFVGGAVDKSGKTLVGQRDGALNAFSTNNPSPRARRRRERHAAADLGRHLRRRAHRHHQVHDYEYQPCGAYFTMQTTQVNRRRRRLRIQTEQTLRSTVQNLQATTQILRVDFAGPGEHEPDPAAARHRRARARTRTCAARRSS